jgi:hypothetical protein
MFAAYAVTVCLDCATYAANNEVETADAAWTVADYAAGCEGGHLSTDGEPHFSSAPCGVCGTWLAGDRFDGTLLIGEGA